MASRMRSCFHSFHRAAPSFCPGTNISGFAGLNFVLLLMGSGPKDEDVLYDAGHPCLSIHLSKIGFPCGAGLGRLERVLRGPSLFISDLSLIPDLF